MKLFLEYLSYQHQTIQNYYGISPLTIILCSSPAFKRYFATKYNRSMLRPNEIKL